ncbi:protein kinase family protein [Paracerasibacillus soli]|uniref:Spore coat protein YutH n=1 Tax=Paracerasibacillus soli TaxID=480284 RepID=A0ABU5CQX7_9BACI|nr:hypothetical protein [Virgibacillus soli]MDY0408784.1 hypothetical protein [Virgibacillus soli]
MRQFLKDFYHIDIQNEVTVYGRNGFMDQQYLYFTIPTNDREVIHMEQAALAYYLYENGYENIGIPIQNRFNEWFSQFEGKQYLVIKGKPLKNRTVPSHGQQLAQFHEIASSFQYEPQEISSYGQWKTLWTDKLTAIEYRLQEKAKQQHNHYYQYLMDILPYVIGVSENAIQYMQESESEFRFNKNDQGVISFRRYENQLTDAFMLSADFVYDHAVRDLAEYIRMNYLLEEADNFPIIQTFLREYEQVRPLSIFSWRLLYARLVFPIHFIDSFEAGFYTEDYDKLYHRLTAICKAQSIYEQRLGTFFMICILTLRKWVFRK